jgi:hypothetical protein
MSRRQLAHFAGAKSPDGVSVSGAADFAAVPLFFAASAFEAAAESFETAAESFEAAAESFAAGLSAFSSLLGWNVPRTRAPSGVSPGAGGLASGRPSAENYSVAAL